ncbi:hypothetical protein, unlikely [Trypanosoma brucei gambiense DAL972]|uniref:T. brucei spp.-specific protein n=1 Tax=Trypanosoma brucei gambiense (strain MHOM/CI/86/DAL972) TaxID=679716 RepID=D0AAR9_TRYB9|nr:hypothetical protein, unlikely [Trypanosoma brucei gambiense DAL972]CBH18770.1 hypothetical protein, unlikely [Trypanosoma brucei gambiense DAL972]|eukprot:XP_011781034.1 hypothetical protein, unlikely [Trypanosoma brucei gambiense DAL972]
MGRSFSPRHITVTITFTLLLFFFFGSTFGIPASLPETSPFYHLPSFGRPYIPHCHHIFMIFSPPPPHAPMPTIQHLLFVILLPFFVSFAFAINISPRNDVLMEHNTPLIRSLPLLLKNTFFSTMV